MKKLFFAAAVLLFAACSTDQTTDLLPSVPNVLTVTFEEDSRIQLDENQKTVWTKGDYVSVFNKTDLNECWVYEGETGARTAELRLEFSGGRETKKLDKIVAIYPYGVYSIAEDYKVTATLPTEQKYLAGSYGKNGNIMVSCGESTNLRLKSVFGWLKLQLTGNGEVVKSIVLTGNKGEQLAGSVVIDPTNASIQLNDSSSTTLTLNCGDGVTLGSEVTTFYIGVPPQTFEEGFTAVVKCSGYSEMELKTNKRIVIERNTIQPMVAVAHNAEKGPDATQIWYTTTDGQVTNIHSYYSDKIKSNIYENGKGVITFKTELAEIASSLFEANATLETVILPESITKIGERAFQNCTNLKSINFPDKLTTIEDWAFAGCSALESISLPNSLTTIGGNVFRECSSLTSVVIPDSVTYIGMASFIDCSSLKSAVLGRGMTQTARYMFGNCTSLESVVIPETITYLFNYTFYNTGFKSFTIPQSVTKIGSYLFESSKSLTEVTIHDKVTEIGNAAFNKCSALTAIYSMPIIPCTIGDSDVFNTNNAETKIYVPSGSVMAYKSLWTQYENLIVADSAIPAPSEVVISYTTTDANPLQFPENSGIVVRDAGTLVLPGSYSALPAGLFKDQTTLETITLPSTVSGICGGAFEGCTSLKKVYSKSTTPPVINEAAFSLIGCYLYVPSESAAEYRADSGWQVYNDYIIGYNFTTGDSDPTPTIPDNEIWFYTPTEVSVTIPEYSDYTVTWNPNTGKGIVSSSKAITKTYSMFNNCSTITRVELPKTIKSVSGFTNCTALKAITLPEGTEDIGGFSGSGLESIVIPNSVTSIGASAFYNCTNLKSVTLPENENFTAIRNKTFYNCTALTECIVPGSVTLMEEEVFKNCTSLTNLVLPEGLEEIKTRAFTNCAFESLNLPSTLLYIPLECCLNCKNLKHITITEGITGIVSDAFKGCTSLESVTLTSTVTEFFGNTFTGCTALTRVNIPSLEYWLNVPLSDVLFYLTDSNNQYLNVGLYINDELIEDLVIPDSVTAIGKKFCSNYDRLKSVTIPSSVTEIGEEAFLNCSNLTAVRCNGTTPPTLGANVFKYSEFAYSNETLYNYYPLNLMIYVPSSAVETYRTHNSWKEYKDMIVDENYVFDPETMQITYTTTDGSMLDLSVGGFGDAIVLSHTYGRIVFDRPVASFAFYVFRSETNASKLKSLTLPKTITEIPNNAFYNCYNLTNAPLRNTVKSIGEYAFENCRSLTNVEVPNSVITIGANAFKGCTNLTRITAGSSVTSVGASAFSGCTKLQTVFISGNNATIAANAFASCGAITSVKFDSVASIADNAFQNMTNLKSVILGNSLTAIPQYAFSGCSALESITIPASVKTIGVRAFESCTKLATVNIAEGVETIAGRAFFECDALTTFVMPNSVTTTGVYVFQNCDNLADVTISNNLTTLDVGILSGCHKLTTIRGNNATSDGKCLVINNNLWAIASSGLKEYSIPEGVKYIDDKILYQNATMEKITIPSTVTNIGEFAFRYCSKLVNVTCLATTPPTIKNGDNGKVFNDANVNRKIYVPSGSVDSYKNAAGWTSYKSSIKAIQ